MDQNWMKRQRELTDRLNRYRNEYYNLNSPSVSDTAYDRLFEELQAVEKQTGVQMANSPTNTVGYAMLTPLSVDRRLLTLRQLLKHGLVSHHMEDQELEQLARCLLEKPFSEWYRGAFGHIRGLTRRTAMWLLRKYEQLRVFIPEMQSEADAIFALNNGAVIAGQKNWTQVRAAVLTMDRDWLDLKERFSITDEFVEQHREPVTNFLLRGGSAMVRALYGYLQGDDKAIEALRRIVQAELMGQFYALKYFADDLQREIRYPISEVQEAAWKRNLTLDRGPFSAEEADDFYFTMQLGELPHSTCLS